MLRNIVCTVLSHSLLNTPKSVPRVTDYVPILHIFCRGLKSEASRDAKEQRPRPDDGIPKDNDKLAFITNMGLSSNIYPNEKTADTLYDGVPYKRLPWIVVKADKNNTKLACHDYQGRLKVIRSSGMEGFKHSKQGTAVAAYVSSVTFGRMTRKIGVTNARLVVNGFGKGREAVLKGLQQVGLQFVSVTDTTPAVYHCPRPKKVRRV